MTMFRSRRFRRRSYPDRPVIDQVMDEHLTYLEPSALHDLWDLVEEADTEARPGDIVEAGCALGGSALVLAAARHQPRPLIVYDVFGMIPPPTHRDGPDVHERYGEISGGAATGIAGDAYYGYRADLLDEVAGTFTRYGFPPSEADISLVPGLYEDTLVPPGPVAVAHVDCDWYASVRVCLDRLWPALVPGGVIVLDDYDAWSGCRAAVDEFVAATPEATVERGARLRLRRGPRP